MLSHLENKTHVNEDKMKKLIKQSMIKLEEFDEFTELLKNALSIASNRLDIPITFLSPDAAIVYQIKHLFEKLHEPKSDQI